jgi:hypothetical protein
MNRLSSFPYTSNYKEISDFPLLSSSTILSHFFLYKSLWDKNMEINDKNLSLIENNIRNKKSDSFWSIHYDPGGFIQNEKEDLLSAIGRDLFVLLAGILYSYICLHMYTCIYVIYMCTNMNICFYPAANIDLCS